MTQALQRRNIGIFAHVDAGKTTTTERILYYSGTSHRIGEVDHGTAVMDWMEQEQNRGITITSATTKLDWNGCEINLIDTPGHVDFTAEVERSLRVLDGGIAIFDAVNGVEPQSETVWRQATRYRIPRLIFINKMDRIGADFQYACQSIRELLQATQHIAEAHRGRSMAQKHLLLLTIPVGAEHEFCGVIDVLQQQLLEWKQDDSGRQVHRREVPEELTAVATEAHHALIETLSDASDEIAEQYLSGEAIEVGLCRQVIRRLTIDEMAFPVFCGASLRNIGVQPLMDAIVEYLPKPEELPDVTAYPASTKKSGATIRIQRRADKPLSALVFKIATDRERGELAYVRVYAGKITRGDMLYNATLNKAERVNKLQIMHANSSKQVGEITAGDIGVVIGLKQARTGDTMTTRNNPHTLEAIRFPQPVISSAIETRSQSERDKLMRVLGMLEREDPTFRWTDDHDTGELVISGMGELHLAVLTTRITDDFNIAAKIGKPQVSYRERLQRTVSKSDSLEIQSGGTEHRISYQCSVGPITRGAEAETETEERGQAFETNENNINVTITVEHICKNESVFERAMILARETVEGVLAGGFLLGYPTIQTQVSLTITDVVSENPLFAIEKGADRVVTTLCQDAAPIQLEPLMTVTVSAPQEYVGEVMSGLQQRGGVVSDIAQMHGEQKRISATVPLAQLFGYSTSIRSATKGRGEFSIEFSRFAPISE